MPRSILVPLDGEAAAEHALPVAARLAAGFGVPLRLVRVHGIVYTEDRREVRPVEEYMSTVADRVRRDAGVQVESVLLEGNPATELTKYVEEQGGSLVVLSTDPKGRLERLLSGSVSEALIRAAGPPVLLVRGDAAAAEAGPYRHVLIPLDGSPGSEQGLDAALESGLLRGAHTTVLHVAEEGGGGEDAAVADPRGYLAGIAERLEGDAAAVDTVVTEGKNAARAILEVAEREGADLIAMSTHGRGGFRDALFGGTAREVVRNARTDLLLARQD